MRKLLIIICLTSLVGIVATAYPAQADTGAQLYVSWPWYLARAAGLVAALTLFILLLSGIGFITGHTFAFLEPITAWATHKALGITFGIAVFLHLVGLYFDNFVPFGFKDLLVPFAAKYQPVQILGISVGSFYVALGVLALYLTAAIIFTSLVLIEKKPANWKAIHLMSYAVGLFVFFHALFLGTDLASGFLRQIWIAFGIILVLAGSLRLWRAKTV